MAALHMSPALTTTAKQAHAPTVCLIEDDPNLALGLKDALEFEGWCVWHCERGHTALAELQQHRPDCIVLDLMLPDMNGYTLCSQLRRTDPAVPILMLTARSQEADKIRGLNAGADDYVTKPFSVGELVARLHALLRRAQQHGQSTVCFRIGAATVDPEAQTIQRDDHSYPLSFYEVELIKHLYKHRGKVVSREAILSEVWGTSPTNTGRSIDNCILKLRRKIESQPDKPCHILTVYGVGYKLSC